MGASVRRFGVFPWRPGSYTVVVGSREGQGCQHGVPQALGLTASSDEEEGAEVLPSACRPVGVKTSARMSASDSHNHQYDRGPSRIWLRHERRGNATQMTIITAWVFGDARWSRGGGDFQIFFACLHDGMMMFCRCRRTHHERLPGPTVRARRTAGMVGLYCCSLLNLQNPTTFECTLESKSEDLPVGRSEKASKQKQKGGSSTPLEGRGNSRAL
jgi:hypothetical protein